MLKLTLDGGLMREEGNLPALATLKAWDAAGKIEINEADRPKDVKPAYGWPGAPPVSPSARPGGGKNRPVQRRVSPSATVFSQLAAVLFPRRDAHKLNMTEINNVAHLMRHQASGHEIFVTNNRRDFIDDGKRERLETVFKIRVMTADETVAMLCESQGWTHDAAAAGLRLVR